MKQSLSTLLTYLTCTNATIVNKWNNLLASFWHKDEGNLIKDIQAVEGGYNVTIIDGTPQGQVVFLSVPQLPNSLPISYIQDLENQLNTKVTKVLGKGLSTNDFTAALKTKLDNLTNYVHPDFHQMSEIEGLIDALDGFVYTADLPTIPLSTFNDDIGVNSTSNNGITKTSNNFQLGGSLDKNTLLNRQSFGFTSFGNENNGYIGAGASKVASQGFGALELGISDAYAFLKEGFRFFTDKTQFDSSTGKGIEYKSNYHAGFSNRSLVDKEYLDLSILNIAKYYDFACSDEDSDLSESIVFSQALTRRLLDCTSFEFGVTNAPSGLEIVIDVQKNGISVFNNAGRIINIGHRTSNQSENLQNITGGKVTFDVGDLLTVEIKQVGSVNAGKGLKAQIRHK